MKSETMSVNSPIFNFIRWLFGLTAFAIGVINTFWGNDPDFGVFIILLSFIYVPPLDEILKKRTGRAIPGILKILVGIFIIWSALGVGELFEKIDMMMTDL